MAVLRQFLFCATAVALLLVAAGASADSRGVYQGFYAGVAATAESADATYDKRLLSQSLMLRDRGAADKMVYGLGVLVGYRMPLNERGVYFGAELDWTHHEGTVRGRLNGAPETPGNPPPFIRSGDSWPERWRFEKERSYGVTFNLGMPFSLAWADPAYLYALAGVRRMEVDFFTHFGGCEEDARYPNCPLVTGSESQDRTMTAWTWGVGLEKMMGETTALRGEVRYTEYENDRRTDLYPASGGGSFAIPRDLDGDAVSLSVGLIRYF